MIMYSKHSTGFFASWRLNHIFCFAMLQVPHLLVIYFVCQEAHFKPVDVFPTLEVNGLSLLLVFYDTIRGHSYHAGGRCFLCGLLM